MICGFYNKHDTNITSKTKQSTYKTATKNKKIVFYGLKVWYYKRNQVQIYWQLKCIFGDNQE